MYQSTRTSRHRQNGLSYVPKKILTWTLREARRVLKATVGNIVQPDYHIIHIVFCSFLFLSARVLCSLAGYAQKQVSTYWTLQALARLGFEEHLIQFNSHCCSFIKTNLRKINYKGLSKHSGFCWQQLFGLLHNNYTVTEAH